MADPIFIPPYASYARFDTSRANDPVIERVTQAYWESPDGKCPGCGKVPKRGSKFCSETCCARWFRAIEKNEMPGVKG